METKEARRVYGGVGLAEMRASPSPGAKGYN